MSFDFYFLEDPPEDHLCVIGGLLVKILVYYYLLLLLSLKICFIIFQLQFPQKDKLSRNRKGYSCIYIRVPRHPSRNKDVIQTSVEVRFHLWFVVTRLDI